MKTKNITVQSSVSEILTNICDNGVNNNLFVFTLNISRNKNPKFKSNDFDTFAKDIGTNAYIF